MKKLPEPSTATPVGKTSSAATAGPPSPAEEQQRELPATVEMIPFATLRMRLFISSAMKRLPDASTATAFGNRKLGAGSGSVVA